MSSFKTFTILQKTLVEEYSSRISQKKIKGEKVTIKMEKNRALRIIKGVCMSDFIEDLEAIRVHQIASGCLQNVFPIK